ncbi:hypothetical protein AAC03nite_13090 [Alicyclobacillus acidoterrestris]|nr:hypothetical protein AAC03nite_13090 [Alicyclobacillus acidoterrestris]
MIGKHQSLKWFRIVGHPYDGSSADFIYFVESTSPRSVIKYHGKRRKLDTGDGTITVQFPSNEKDV